MKDKANKHRESRPAKTPQEKDEHKYRAIFDNSPFAMSLTKMPENIIVDANRQFLKIFGYTREKVIGRTAHESGIVDHESGEKIAAMLSGSESIRGFEVIRSTESGGSMTLWFNIDCIIIEGDTHVLTTIRDITEHKQRLETVKEAEALLRAVLEQMPSGVSVREAGTGRQILSNSRSKEILGHLIVLQDDLDNLHAVHTDGSPFMIADWPVSRSLATGEIVHSEEIGCERSDGSHITLSVSSAPVRNTEGRIMAAVAIYHDITERRRFLTRFKKAAEKYSTLFNNTSDGVWISDMKGKIVEVNDAYCRMSGYSREELILMSVSKVDVSKTPQELEAHSRKIIETGGTDRFEARHRRKDGSVFDTDMSALYFDKDGGRMAVFVRDITDRRLAEEAIRENQARLEAVFAAIPYVIVEFDVNLDTVRANPAALKVTGQTLPGLTRDTIIKKLKFRHTDGTEINPGDLPTSRSLQGKTVSGEEYLITSIEGDERIVSIYTAPLYNNGRINGVLALWDDITERKQGEIALKESYDELDRFNRAMIGREARMIELKNEVNELCSRSGQSKRYALNFENGEVTKLD